MGDFRKKYPVDWFRGKNFKIENTPIKDTSGKRKFKRMLSFLSVDKRKLFAMKLSFEEFNLVSTRRIGVLGLFWTNQGSEVSEDTWGIHSILYDQSKVRFLKGIFVFIKVSWTFSTFWHRRERKTTKCAFEIDFLPCAQLIELASTDAGSS